MLCRTSVVPRSLVAVVKLPQQVAFILLIYIYYSLLICVTPSSEIHFSPVLTDVIWMRSLSVFSLAGQGSKLSGVGGGNTP